MNLDLNEAVSMEIRNPKLEIRNNFKISESTNVRNEVLSLSAFWSFGFVSDFVLRASDFSRRGLRISVLKPVLLLAFALTLGAANSGCTLAAYGAYALGKPEIPAQFTL